MARQELRESDLRSCLLMTAAGLGWLNTLATFAAARVLA